MSWQLLENGSDVIERIDHPHLKVPKAHIDLSNVKVVDTFLSSIESKILAEASTPSDVETAMRNLFAVLHLARRSMDQDNWHNFVDHCRNHKIKDTLHQDCFTRHSFERPRGYPGDAALLDFIYNSDMGLAAPEMSLAGQRIHPWTINSTACNGVKERRALIARLIDETVARSPGAEILSIAGGHFREAELSLAVRRKQTKRVLVVDSDRQSLDEVEDLSLIHI